MTTKKHESIEFRLTIQEKRTIKASMQNGELSDVCRALLLMYAEDSSLREQVRLYRLTQGWQEP